jgi:2-polyprenyl-3-methyl-5-hydroxy-6-metoxy-1,4-benzoquinol methylase
MTLRDVKDIEAHYSALDTFNSPAKRALMRPPLERYFYYLRYEIVQGLVDGYAKAATKVLDLGCGFGVNTFYMCENLSVPVAGLDLDKLKLVEASLRAENQSKCERIAFVTADVCRPPFKASSFDCILMTEVLEHLIRPDEGLRACSHLLPAGGILILTVPSRHNLNYSANPFQVLEKIFSLVSDRVLPSYHNLHARFEYNRKDPETQYGMHHHFSFQRLSAILQKNGFEGIFRGSFEIEIPLFPIIDLLSRGDVEKIRKYVGPIEAILERIPFLKHLGQHQILILRKTADLRDRN